MSKTMIMDHPLVQHKVSLLRNKNTGTKEFKELVCELATLLCYEATRDLPTEEVEIETPIAVAKTRMLSGRKLALVPILRAGLGMVDGMLALIPAAKVGHIGMYRNEETLEPVEYYCKLPSDIAERDVIILDPMLATGGSASAAITFVKEYGVKNIKLMNILAAPEGIERVRATTPTWKFTSPPWMKSSTSTATSSPAWATPATGSSARSKIFSGTVISHSVPCGRGGKLF